jgi:hypothetical protein
VDYLDSAEKEPNPYRFLSTIGRQSSAMLNQTYNVTLQKLASLAELGICSKRLPLLLNNGQPISQL